MTGEWREMPFSEAVALNPAVQLKRGSEYPFVDMQAVNAGSRCVYPSERRSFNRLRKKGVCGEVGASWGVYWVKFRAGRRLVRWFEWG